MLRQADPNHTGLVDGTTPDDSGEARCEGLRESIKRVIVERVNDRCREFAHSASGAGPRTT